EIKTQRETERGDRWKSHRAVGPTCEPRWDSHRAQHPGGIPTGPQSTLGFKNSGIGIGSVGPKPIRPGDPDPGSAEPGRARLSQGWVDRPIIQTVSGRPPPAASMAVGQFFDPKEGEVELSPALLLRAIYNEEVELANPYKRCDHLWSVSEVSEGPPLERSLWLVVWESLTSTGSSFLDIFAMSTTYESTSHMRGAEFSTLLTGSSLLMTAPDLHSLQMTMGRLLSAASLEAVFSKIINEEGHCQIITITVEL
ncbi:hypothetical protein Taro_013366, partial [Colocasia esculenta]|nr:hypothetical protein [Colocasia esculenta]